MFSSDLQIVGMGFGPCREVDGPYLKRVVASAEVSSRRVTFALLDPGEEKNKKRSSSYR